MSSWLSTAQNECFGKGTLSGKDHAGLKGLGKDHAGQSHLGFGKDPAQLSWFTFNLLGFGKNPAGQILSP